MALTVALTALGALALCAWLGVLLDPGRGWQLRPQAEEEPAAPPPPRWPEVAVVIPARNEADVLVETLPSVLGQDYPGALSVILVDDRSTDGTGRVAKRIGEAERGASLEVIVGAPLPDGWVGKVWAMEQGSRAVDTRAPAYLLLTDADIWHDPMSLRELVAQAEHEELALNSRMARLRCRSRPERLLIPAFVYFFNLLYPMRRVNDPGSSVAAAAGGCVLVRRPALESTGGLEAIRGEIIDDVNLARQLKGAGLRIQLAVSRATVVSKRRYERIGPIWRMVRRTAFDELDYSWLRVVGTVLSLTLLFLVPPALMLLAVALALAGIGADDALAWPWLVVLGALGLGAYGLMTLSLAPAIRLFGLSRRWQLVLPVAGVMYGGMTVDSAIQHARRREHRW